MPSSSSSSSSLGIFTPVWPYPRYDAIRSANTPLLISGYDIKNTIPVNYLSNHYITTPLLLNYSGTLSDEIVYVGASENGPTNPRVFAIRSNGDMLWVSEILAGTPATSLVIKNLTMSQTKKQLYCTLGSTSEEGNYASGDKYVYCLSSEDGRQIWQYNAGAVGIYTETISDDKNNLFVAATFTSGGSYAAITSRRLNETTGAFIDKFDIAFTETTGLDEIICSKPMAADANKDYIYFVVKFRYTRVGSGSKTRLIKVKTSDNTAQAINMLVNGTDEALIACNGIAINSDSIYVTSDRGLFKFSAVEAAQKWHYNQSLTNPTEPSIANDGTIYYRENSTVYAVTDNGLSYSIPAGWPVTGLSALSSNNVSIILDQNDKIITCSNNTAGNNIVLLNDDGSIYDQHAIGNTINRTITRSPMIGTIFSSETQNFYVPYNDTSGGNLGIIYVLYDASGPSSSSSSSLSSTSSSSSQSSQSQSLSSESQSSQSEIPTIITPPLNTVQTTKFYELISGQWVATETSNASDSPQTSSTALTKSFSFGTVAPKETSRTVIISLNIPGVKAITNIKLGLINAGGIDFTTNIFGISTSPELTSRITPSIYFSGINTDNTKDNVYNISIPNKDNHTSEYVYLNIKLPQNHTIRQGIIRFHWFYDYCDI